jgi:fatty acid desaturase
MTNRDPRDPRDPHDPGASRPRSEPEVIPPDHTGRSRRGGIWVSIDENGSTRRVYMARPGPFTIILALAILALIGVVMLIVLLSVAVIWIPVVIILIAAFVLSVTFRQYWWRFRSWLARR